MVLVVFFETSTKKSHDHPRALPALPPAFLPSPFPPSFASRGVCALGEGGKEVHLFSPSKNPVLHAN